MAKVFIYTYFIFESSYYINYFYKLNYYEQYCPNIFAVFPKTILVTLAAVKKTVRGFLGPILQNSISADFFFNFHPQILENVQSKKKYSNLSVHYEQKSSILG
jgi:hypothetical protein